jgi:hypothetical protein
MPLTVWVVVHKDADPVLKVEQLLADDADHRPLDHLGQLQQAHAHKWKARL